MHNRLSPKTHRFHYNVFMFYVDLDELEMLRNKFFLFSHNKFNFFSFRDREHLQLPANEPDLTKTTKEHIFDYLKQNSVSFLPHKIMLLTNMNILGYNFNPVSFYFCFDENDKPLYSIAEVGNTFGEMKPYLLTDINTTKNKFHLYTTKYFYVSPFMDHDNNFDFNLIVPDEKLNIRIDTFKETERIFISTLTGQKRSFTNLTLCWYAFRFPFLTVRIISLIHWNALLLWMKKLTFHKKGDKQNLQQGVLRKYNKKSL